VSDVSEGPPKNEHSTERVERLESGRFEDAAWLPRYGVAVLAVALAVALKALLAPFTVQDTPFLLVLVSVMVAAWYGGLGPGLVATALSAPLVDYLFLTPVNSFSGLSLESTPLVLFAVEGVSITLLVVALHSARRRAEEHARHVQRREAELRRSEERFRLLVDGVKDYAIFMLDPEGRVATWNEGAERIEGYEEEDVLGRHFSIFYPEADRLHGKPQRQLERAASAAHVEDEGWRVRKDGSTFWANVVLTPLTNQEGILRGFSKITRDVTEHRQAEERVRQSLASLLTLHEASRILLSTLDHEEIVASLLRIARSTPSVAVAAVSFGGEGPYSLHCQGVMEPLFRVRILPEIKTKQREALESGTPQVLWLPTQPRSDNPSSPSELSEELSEEDTEDTLEDADVSVGLFLPLGRLKESAGVLEVYGTEALVEEGTPETLASLANLAGSALENARLYEDLAEREHRMRDLVGQIMVAQEEERRRVAYEIHDGLTQTAVAAYQYLQDFAGEHPPSSARGRKELEETVQLVRQTVTESRQVIADLRPTVLDDLGLAAAVRQQAERLRAEAYRVEYVDTLGPDRLQPPVEVALFRVAQEALTNVRKHARTDRVEVALERLEDCIRLTIRDAGSGFSPQNVDANGEGGDRVGLSSMQERTALLGGTFEIDSAPGVGTTVTVKVPLHLAVESEGGGSR
jgi:PAS domain S-box-containing protein